MKEMLQKKLNIIYSLVIVLLTLCCLFVGKAVFMPDTIAYAASKLTDSEQIALAIMAASDQSVKIVGNDYSYLAGYYKRDSNSFK